MAKTPGILGQFIGKSCEADVHNNNDMNLSSELFDKITSSDEYKRAIKNGHYLGYLGHPDNPDYQHYQDACIVMRSMKRVGKDIEATFDLLDTPVGRIVKTLEDAGIHLGISIRGAGDVDTEGYVDPDTFIFRGYDLVGFPAYNDCIPKFIAASTNTKAKSNYQKICAAVKTNLKYITSTSTLEALQSQFAADQPEYQLIGDRIDEINNTDDTTDEDTTDEDTIEVLQQKLDGMTSLFLEQKQLNEQLSQELIESGAQIVEIEAKCNRKIASLKRITANQVKDLRKSKDKIVASNTRLANQLKQLKTANTKIQSQKDNLSEKLEHSKKENLKYNQKVVANSRIISEKDSTIGDLQSRLDETVAESRRLKIQASNLEATNKEYLQRITAAEQMVLSYQKAYANIYANALGVHLDDISVTASTSVEQLQQVINASTSTSNIGAAPYVDNVIDEEFDDEPLVDLTSDDDIVIL